MSAQNVEVIQRVYQAAANGDALGFAWLDERFAFAYRSAPELSSGMETVNDPKWRPERYVDLKGRILVQVKLLGRCSESSNEIKGGLGTSGTSGRASRYGSSSIRIGSPAWS